MDSDLIVVNLKQKNIHTIYFVLVWSRQYFELLLYIAEPQSCPALPVPCRVLVGWFFFSSFVLRHSLRLNAEVADTASQKSFWPFCKFWCQNLNYRNIVIFIGHMFLMEKSTFSRWKAVKCFHQYLKMAKFRKYS